MGEPVTRSVQPDDTAHPATPDAEVTGFRADIEGLRGIAVALVVLFHAGLAMPGGFIGVDVFFVVSGYLITGLLVREFERSGTISFANFYARRIRRLLPAATVVILAVLAVIALPFVAKLTINPRRLAYKTMCQKCL